jgi:uncharacterized protein (TIGR00255 family)
VNLKHVWIVFKKEVRDIARDRRTLITNLLIPIILMPLLFAFMGGGMSKMEEDIENITIALTAQSDTEEIRMLLEDEVFVNYPNITEEVVRMKSHLTQLRQNIKAGGCIGRKLDFIVQEMNREANTIGSKSSDITITSYVVDMKSEIEKIREQVQNIE